MKETTKTLTMKEVAKRLAGKALEQNDPAAALHLTQASLNLAQATKILEDIEKANRLKG